MGLLINSCVEVRNQYSAIPPGIWRATLTVDGSGLQKIINTENETDRVFTEMTDGELPFNFEVSYINDTIFNIEIINDSERILVEDIEFGKNLKTGQDTIRINFPIFDSYISGIYEEDKIQGYWIVNYRENYKIPFNAVFGQGHRFTTMIEAPTLNLNGKWEATFELNTEDEYKGVCEFIQEGNRLSGTIRTETGDFRYLEGTVQGNKAFLSCFDGAHAFLFQAKILEDGSLTGSFRSGTHYATTWTAEKNDSFELSDPNTLTFLKGQEKFFFNFENTNGNYISIENEEYKGKPLIVSIFGTWCPNCRDEMEFLKEYKEMNQDLEFNVVGIGFEKYKDKTKSLNALKRYKDKMDIPFDLLLGGFFEKDQAINQLPMLNKIISYPTLILLDKEKNIRQIHTGFSGPATSKYESFKKDFDQLIKSLVHE